MSQKPLPAWWDWELEFTPHVEKRMTQRDFTELDVRRMLSVADHVEPGDVFGRWAVKARYRKKDWVVILEPDPEEYVIAVVTAYFSE